MSSKFIVPIRIEKNKVSLYLEEAGNGVNLMASYGDDTGIILKLKDDGHVEMAADVRRVFHYCNADEVPFKYKPIHGSVKVTLEK